MGNNNQGQQQGGKNNPTQLAHDVNVNALAAAAAGGIRMDGRRGMKMVETGTGRFALESKDGDKMPCLICVDNADIDGLALTNKVAELLKDQRTVRIPGGLEQIFGRSPDKKEVFSCTYHFMSMEIHKTFKKTDDVIIDAPQGTRIEFTAVTYQGRDFTSEAQTLLLGKRELQLTAGSVESALCGRLIIDTTAGDFHFLYKLHSTPSEHISCLLSENFYIPPSRSYEMMPTRMPPTTTNTGFSTYRIADNNNNNNHDQEMTWSQNPLNRDRGSESSRQPTTSAPAQAQAAVVVPPPPTYLFNGINANKAALESIFQKHKFVSKF